MPLNQYQKSLEYESLKATISELEETLARTGLDLIIFQASPHADKRWLTQHGRFGAQLFDSSGGAIPNESEDCEYGPTPIAAINNLIDRWANWQPGQDWPASTRSDRE